MCIAYSYFSVSQPTGISTSWFGFLSFFILFFITGYRLTSSRIPVDWVHVFKEGTNYKGAESWTLYKHIVRTILYVLYSLSLYSIEVYSPAESGGSKSSSDQVLTTPSKSHPTLLGLYLQKVCSSCRIVSQL